jgi:hypothetical protein
MSSEEGTHVRQNSSLVVGLLFDREFGSDTFLRNVGRIVRSCTATPYSSQSSL